MLFILISLISCKAMKANARNFNSFLAKRPISFVLFTSQRCQPCKRIQNSMDTVSIKYRDTVNMIFVDIDESQPILLKYNILYVPQIAVFRDSTFLKFYTGEWTVNAISEFLGNVLNENIYYLNSSFSIFDFQNKEPATLILSSPEMTKKADGLLLKYGGAFHIGVVEDPKLATSLGLPPASFIRPYGELNLPIEDLSKYDLVNLSKSPFDKILNSEIVGSTVTEFTFMSLIDDRDPLHLSETITRMKLAHEFFGTNISYQYCDFFTCANVVQQLGLINFMNPCYVIHIKEQNGRQRLEPYRKMANKPDDILAWLKFITLGIDMPKEKEEVYVPRLYAHDFIEKALDPKMDVILLVAATGMQMYDESINNFRILIQIFKDIKTVKFYEFNRFTEHVQGLELPQSDKPLLSIWPASAEPRGSTFGAYLSLPIILENLLKIITTQVDDDTLQGMTDLLQKILKEQASNK